MKYFRISLGVVGAVALLSGVAHFVWYILMREYPELAGMSEAQWRFLALLNCSVGLLLVSMGCGALAVAASRSAGLSLLRVVAAVLFATWSARFVFELLLPVPIPFFGLRAPSALFEALIAALLATLAAPELLLLTGVGQSQANVAMPEVLPTDEALASANRRAGSITDGANTVGARR